MRPRSASQQRHSCQSWRESVRADSSSARRALVSTVSVEPAPRDVPRPRPAEQSGECVEAQRGAHPGLGRNLGPCMAAAHVDSRAWPRSASAAPAGPFQSGSVSEQSRRMLYVKAFPFQASCRCHQAPKGDEGFRPRGSANRRLLSFLATLPCQGKEESADANTRVQMVLPALFSPCPAKLCDSETTHSHHGSV